MKPLRLNINRFNKKALANAAAQIAEGYGKMNVRGTTKPFIIIDEGNASAKDMTALETLLAEQHGLARVPIYDAKVGKKASMICAVEDKAAVLEHIKAEYEKNRHLDPNSSNVFYSEDGLPMTKISNTVKTPPRTLH